MLSVVVPCYNAAHILPVTVPVLLAQEEPAEFIFVDDGSSDETAATLASLTRVREDATRILHHETNRGRSAARNTGIAQATGEIVVFLDADVAPTANFLTNLKRAVEREGVVAARGRIVVAPDLARRDAYFRYARSSRRGPAPGAFPDALPWKFFLAGASCVRAEALAQAGAFDETVSYGEDLELAARLSKRHPGGLRYASNATVELHDVGTLESTLEKMTTFGRDTLPRLVQRYPELARWTGVDVLDSAGSGDPRALLRRVLLAPLLAATTRRILPVLPAVLSSLAVRYLLGSTLARSYLRGRVALSR